MTSINACCTRPAIRRTSLVAAGALALLFLTGEIALAGAQVGPGSAGASSSLIRVQAPPQQLPPRTQPQPQLQPPPKAAPKREPSAAAPPSDAQLRQRVEQLEEQLVDMQVLVGTLESLARGGGGGGGTPRPGGAGPSTGASEAARIDALETQVRAMTSQIEQLTQQLRQQSGRRDEGPPIEREPPGRSGSVMPPAGSPPGSPSGFGSVVVTPQGGRDPIGQIIRSNPGPSEQPALPPAITEAGNSKDLYETAYGYLLQQDYGAAEAAFDEFLRRYPSDPLAADAQYWMGETLYVQRRYKPAGQAFLKVVQQYRQSAKAPNSLLMLAMSLEQLGQKDCGLFTELETKHPNAPADVKGRARIVKQRVGC